MAKVRSAENALTYTWHYTANQEICQHGCRRIAVIGVGGAGSNTVTRLVESGMTSAKCIALDTDAAHLNASKANQKILIGEKFTKGLGAGGNPKLGRAAIEESRKRIQDLLSDIDVAFITAGLGGGTGTGAAPVVAEIAKRNGAITVGVIAMPFHVEKGREKHAATALTEIQRQCDTVVVIDNNKLKQLAPQLPSNGVFTVTDQVLANMMKGIVETVSTPSLINLDFTDFRTIVGQGGIAVVGVGESDAPNRAEEAVRNALRTPLLDVDYTGATGALVHVTGDNHMTIEEANHVGEIVTEIMDRNAHVIWGARVNPQQEGKLKVTLVMTGVKSHPILGGLGTVAPQLFNMEPYAEPERPLGIKLNLYQMESNSHRSKGHRPASFS